MNTIIDIPYTYSYTISGIFFLFKGVIMGMRLRLQIFIFLFIYITCAFCVEYGSITGTTYEKETGEFLPWVSVMVQGTVLGTSSDSEGRFELLHLESGEYTLYFRLIGYKNVIQRNIIVHPNETVQLAIQMHETAIETPEVVVTASKRAQAIEDLHTSIVVVSSKELQQKNQVYLNEYLENVPGVNFLGGQINIRGSSGYSYGVGSRVLLLVDGVPTMTADNGEIKWNFVPIDQIERVEIVKSAGSALYGSSALGGVINIITKKATRKPATNISLSSGFYDDPPYPEWIWTEDPLYFNDLDVNHSRSIGNTRVFFSLGGHQSTGYRQNGGYTRFNGSGKAIFKLSSLQKLTLQSQVELSDSDIGIMWHNRNQALSVDPESVGDRSVSDRESINAIHEWAVNKTLGLKSRLSYFRNYYQNKMHDNHDYSTAQRFGAEVQGTLLPSDFQTMIFGAEQTLDRVTSNALGLHNIYTSSAYYQQEIKILSSLIMTIGWRFDFTNIDGDKSYQQFSPKGGLVWHFTDHATLRLSSGKGFRVPSVTEMFPTISAAGLNVIPNLDLEPETGWSHEIGVATPLAPFLLLDVAVFQNNFWDLIEPLPDADNNVQFINVTRARIMGIETNLQFSFFEQRLTGNIGYTTLDPQDLEMNTTLAYRSKNMWNFSIAGTIRQFDLGLDYRHYDRLDEVKVYPNDPRVAQKVLDVRVTWNQSRYSVSLNLNNALNHMHTMVERTILPVRHLVLTVKWKI